MADRMGIEPEAISSALELVRERAPSFSLRSTRSEHVDSAAIHRKSGDWTDRVARKQIVKRKIDADETPAIESRNARRVDAKLQNVDYKPDGASENKGDGVAASTEHLKDYKISIRVTLAQIMLSSGCLFALE